MKMKLIAFGLFILSTAVSFAGTDRYYEVTPSESDFLPEQPKEVPGSPGLTYQMLGAEFRIKLVKCEGKAYGLLYRWNKRDFVGNTQFSGVCAWSNRSSYAQCMADSEPETIACYNKAIDFLQLPASRKVKIEDISGARSSSPAAEIPNLDVSSGR